MAFKRYANALLSKSNIEFEEWSDTIKKQHNDIIKYLEKNLPLELFITLMEK